LARLAADGGDLPLALRYLEKAAELARDDELYLRIIRQIAFLLKRLGEHRRAAVLWQEILSLAASDLASAEELAKFYEHRAKDLYAARQVTRRALALAWAERSPLVGAFEHRLQRIENKLRRQAAEL
jgi:tetratricopeptide (TPR) repeat protein